MEASFRKNLEISDFKIQPHPASHADIFQNVRNPSFQLLYLRCFSQTLSSQTQSEYVWFRIP